MARPTKQGLDYFPLDVDFYRNIKVRKIKRACGPQAIEILLCLLANIYRETGYYVGWDEDTVFLVADEVGAKEGLVDEVVAKAVQVNFFDQPKFNEFKILTSLRIQATYLEATAKRKSVALNQKFVVNDDGNLVNDNINSINDVNNEQSKVNKSKVNKSKKDKPAHQQAEYPPDSQYYQLANYLFEKIKGNNSEFKPPNLQKWSDDIRKMIEIDKRSAGKVKTMIEWSQANDFWFANILSAKKLREKYDTMAMQGNQEAKQAKLGNKRGKSTRVEKLPEWAKKDNYSNHNEPEIDVPF